ncbi:hypothetical protein T4A_6838 [Trichinella pseudospiralis]|uniref:Uncharacterized protein n=1 Tax=Trichinella pseudospiralis TaxID=6337 RepID=A0A0V1EKX9_TRIPS|nr:hypothetical protein T4A_6838 [Trichinella pseudospiralis]
MHTSYNDGRAIATTKTDPPLNNFQFNFANRKQNAILDYCESTAIASASHDSIYSMCNLLLLQVAFCCAFFVQQCFLLLIPERTMFEGQHK